MQQLISREDVAAAVAQLAAAGKRPSATAIRAVLGRGSLTTVIKLKAELDAGAAAAPETEQAKQLFAKVWEAATAEARSQAREQMDAAGVDLQAVMAELERAEGEISGLRREAADLQASLETARTAANLANEKALAGAAALEASANERAEQAAKLSDAYRQLSELRATLGAQLSEVTERAHQMELAKTRAEAALDAHLQSAKRSE